MADGALRLDQWLVAHGYAATRSRARWLVETGQVWARGQRCRKPSLLLPNAYQVEIRGRGLPYVSRGGLKLERALSTFGIEVAGLVALDIGASTGGFTDCLLQRGAQRVYAVDVAVGQLALKLREDPRVIALESRNTRALQAADLPAAVDLITVDVSFISLSHVLPILPPLLQPRGRVVALVKPQFEVGAEHVGRGGIVRDPHRRALALRRVMTVAEDAGFRVLQATETPGLHARGNQEIFIDLGWGAERGMTAAGQQRIPALSAPTSSLKAATGIDVEERG
jgi:23S rRNA (cytidine1920-2'-O)/16S rRNA (cytidine1409-2'-O)-methyltransferase